MSFKDLIKTNYGFSSDSTENDKARIKKCTDYAVYKGLEWYDSDADWWMWWLRSPAGDYPNYASQIALAGNVDDNGAVNCRFGLVPAMLVTF